MRYLALDLGRRRVGVAISDALGMLARPLEVFKRSSRVADFAHVAELVKAQGAETLVIGLPLQMDGSEGENIAWVREYSAAMEAAVGTPVEFWDERLTTVEAEDIMREQGKVPDKNWIDAVAAAVILQGYLDARRSQNSHD
ncbi:MAG TPA: Holliday junction resolvase RuvX [Anaerolineae bacterium]|nr:Holliday junction resolvase RuvX [Anaerolineae bacterium]